MDNAIVRLECMLKKQKASQLGYFCQNLDMNKAYDLVEFDFGKAMMLSMGLLDGWVKKVMNYISSSSFSMLINGMKGSGFFTTKGPR